MVSQNLEVIHPRMPRTSNQKIFRKRDHEAVSQSPSDWEPLPVCRRSRLELLEVYYQEIANKSAQRQKKGKEATASFN
jgi:hypothetical protein